ncbi:MAG: L-seryl-tRNA(Sec) selenium transferase [Polyangiaceae bacterium]
MPRVDRLLGHPRVLPCVRALGVARVTALVRATLEGARREILEGKRAAAPTEEEAAERVEAAAATAGDGVARRVINATGVVLHTNLGRAPLAPEALAAVARPGYAAIELDLATGKRGRRGASAEDALVALTGGEDALVVNNGAAAVMLALAAVAKGRDVIVSRGELVEIGGGFRVPEVLEASGARLVEVGTTNKTRAADYARALERASAPGALLRVHRGNFRMIGFVEQPSLEELALVARRFDVPLVEDLGGGALFDFAEHGLSGEPLVRDSIRAGVDLVCFSTDKALGGPQGGVVLGRRTLVEKARREPLARALRLGRLPLAALEATLQLYARGRATDVPAVALAVAPLDVVEARAARIAAAIGASARVVATDGEMGGGTFAGRPLRSFAVELPAELAEPLRAGDPSVLGRVVDGALHLDARTLSDDEATEVARLCVALGKPIG